MSIWQHATLGVTPREAYVTGLELGGARGHRRIAYDAEFLMATLPAPRHKTAKAMPGQGVKVYYLFYWHEALRHPEVERTRVPVRYDPFDIGVVYAYVLGQWAPCRSQYYAAFVGHSEKELALATAVFRQQARMSHRAASITPIRLAEFFAQVYEHERVLVQRLRDQEAHAVFEGIAAGIEGRTAREPTARPAPTPAAAHARTGATALFDPVDLSTLPNTESSREHLWSLLRMSGLASQPGASPGVVSSTPAVPPGPAAHQVPKPPKRRRVGERAPERDRVGDAPPPPAAAKKPQCPFAGAIELTTSQLREAPGVQVECPTCGARRGIQPKQGSSRVVFPPHPIRVTRAVRDVRRWSLRGITWELIGTQQT